MAIAIACYQNSLLAKFFPVSQVIQSRGLIQVLIQQSRRISQVCFAKILRSYLAAQNLVILLITQRTRFLLIYIILINIKQLKLKSWSSYNINLNYLGDLLCFWQQEQYLIKQLITCLLISLQPKHFSTLYSLFTNRCLKWRWSQQSLVTVRQQGFQSNKWVINNCNNSSHNRKG